MSEELAHKISLVFERQPEGGYTVTCPLLPELITEGGNYSELVLPPAPDDESSG